MSRTPRDSTYARVAAGGDYDADWEEHYAPPPPPNLKRAAQAPKKIATVGAAGPDRWARDDYYTADPYQGTNQNIISIGLGYLCRVRLKFNVKLK